ncbi:FBP C-terminal treble-clef zinc-finger [Pedococcus dokdonensis]|uniref:FBP C-terminal treble-clef zinc-finger n=1 Tax=Pedococcus dokdonensis TaxID=443156 RepID=A0A1H0SJK2_9MICO|nr:FBP domain-containing protein [Pedococcus dokdonensis]SDP41326.1 FBP C-terminal treble-clef zinc-finger [Pedococcus dokdonensis]
MDSLTETQVRASFVNATKGEVARLHVPRDLGDQPWADLDLLGWTDPKSPLRGYLVVPVPDRGPVGVQLARVQGGSRRARMCSLCATTHPSGGVALMVAPRAGRSGRDGNTVGLEMCTSLACSAYARGRLKSPSPHLAQETLSVEERVGRLSRNAIAFVERVLK